MPGRAQRQEVDYVRELEAGARHINTSSSVRTSKYGCCSEYHRFTLR